MASVSIYDVITEHTRQQETGDDNFYKSNYYVLKIKTLQMKGPGGYLGEAYFPLPINPDDFEYTLPYGTEITPLQESGVNVDEGGIVTGNIRMSATTGF